MCPQLRSLNLDIDEASGLKEFFKTLNPKHSLNPRPWTLNLVSRKFCKGFYRNFWEVSGFRTLGRMFQECSLGLRVLDKIYKWLLQLQVECFRYIYTLSLALSPSRSGSVSIYACNYLSNHISCNLHTQHLAMFVSTCRSIYTSMYLGILCIVYLCMYEHIMWLSIGQSFGQSVSLPIN